jgi:hypothetical protein
MSLYRSTTALIAATLLALAACDRPRERPIVVRIAAPEGCSTELTTRPAHPFLAEFTRQIAVTCAGTTTTLRLQPDSGGLGRIELVALEGGDLAVTDAFQSAVVRLGRTAPIDDGLHEGKLDRYSSPCVRSQVFQRRHGKFLGAFDYCEHRWVFLRAP